MTRTAKTARPAKRAKTTAKRARPTAQRAKTTAKRASTTAHRAKAPTTLAPPADHDDPRFTAVLDAFAADPERAAVAEDFAASQMAGGRRRFGSRALKVDGKIFAMLSHGRFVVKLPAARVDAMVAGGDGVYFDPGHGRKMKQWLSLTSSRLSWIELAIEAYVFVADRPPTP